VTFSGVSVHDTLECTAQRPGTRGAVTPTLQGPMEKFEISDSKLEHNDWRFPKEIKTRPLRELDDDDFLINHKVGKTQL